MPPMLYIITETGATIPRARAGPGDSTKAGSVTTAPTATTESTIAREYARESAFL